MPVLTLVSIAAFALLLLLGHWQWRRFEAKTALAAAPIETITLGPVEAAPTQGVALSGLWGRTTGWRILRPVRVAGRVILVDAQFAPGIAPPDISSMAAPKVLAEGAILSGSWVTPNPPGAFSPPPDTARRAFYAYDAAAIAAALDLPAPTDRVFAMAYRDATGADTPNPFAHSRDPLPAERHLGYAATWWGLAIGLIAVYFGLHARAGRLRLRPRD
jgi:surfeit locus 1 family protein